MEGAAVFGTSATRPLPPLISVGSELVACGCVLCTLDESASWIGADVVEAKPESSAVVTASVVDVLLVGGVISAVAAAFASSSRAGVSLVVAVSGGREATSTSLSDAVSAATSEEQ